MIDYFINCDWGTTHFRLRLVNGVTGDVIAQLSTDDGVAGLAIQAAGEKRAELFRATLNRHVRDLGTQADVDVKRIPIVISGMASSSIGWRELPYARLPFPLDASEIVWQSVSDTDVFLLSGVQSDSDVLRGEETEVIGIAHLPEIKPLMTDAILLLPGTHSKHIQVVDNRIVDFHTHMTGELYHVFRHHSSLLHSTQLPMGKGDVKISLTSSLLEDFYEGLDKSKKASLSANLFRVRSRQLLDYCDPVSNATFLSGLLIGAELLSLRKQWPDKNTIVLCAGIRLYELYRIALEILCPSSSIAVVPPASVDKLSAIGQALAFKRILSGRLSSNQRECP